ncbi:MAG: hypothetical protein RBT15_10040, partial [Gudongella sp.]|nr:hypothetical protein [Gudongella sp.]
IVDSGIDIYIFVFKKKEISSVFKALINYTRQLTLTELSSKLDRLNELNANDPSQKEKAINIFSEINGQIKGNKRLREQFSEVISELESYCVLSSRVTEPRKRSLVSQIREIIRSYDVDTMTKK